VAVSLFPGEQYQAPRSWAEQAYPNLIYFNEVDRGGHFAAWEQPELFSEEIRAVSRPVRATSFGPLHLADAWLPKVGYTEAGL
jgi:hypothetical protein